MSEHDYGEPWHVFNGYKSIDIEWHPPRGGTSPVAFDLKTSKRVVACVNALAGVPTEALEAGAVVRLVVAARSLGYYDCFDKLARPLEPFRNIRLPDEPLPPLEVVANFYRAAEVAKQSRPDDSVLHGWVNAATMAALGTIQLQQEVDRMKEQAGAVRELVEAAKAMCENRIYAVDARLFKALKPFAGMKGVEK